MSDFTLIVLLILALLGHGACWLALVNRVEALGWNRRFEKTCVAIFDLGMFALVLAVCLTVWRSISACPTHPLPWPAWTYLVGFAVVAAGPVLAWTIGRLTTRPTPLLLGNHTVLHDLRSEMGVNVAGGPLCRLLLSLPFNECLSLSVHEKTLRLPGLNPALAGLSIAHLSDLHLSGKIGLPWFRRVVELTNDLNADLVAVTGDLVEQTAYLPWAEEILGQIRSRHGVYFILGNHDLRCDCSQLRRRLANCGLVDLSGEAATVEVRGRRLLLAGNERPWFRLLPFESQPEKDAAGDDGSTSDLRILLSHSPDQIGWARRHGFDLMLAGHTHGGQVRLPGLGAIVSPSLYGGKYASGLFDEPPTLMHVSRGLSGLHLLRWNCPPELTKLVLTGE